MSLVVIVEPDELSYLKLKDLLGTVESDITYQVVSSPDKAVDLLKEGKIDILISEIEMSVMSGKELFSLAEMLSPGTVRIAMTSAKKIRETVAFMNECKVFKIIITPVGVVNDVTDPVAAAIQYKELCEKMYTEAASIDDNIFSTEEDFRRMEDRYITNSVKYDNVIKILTSLIDTNIELDNMAPETKEKLKDWYQWLLETYVNTLTQSNGDYMVCRNTLMDRYHSESNGRTFHMYKKSEFSIPAYKMNEITYMTMLMANTCFMLLEKYDIRVLLEDTEKYYIVRFECNYASNIGEDGKLLFKESDEAFRKELFTANEKFVNIFLYREVALAKENKYYVNIAVTK